MRMARRCLIGLLMITACHSPPSSRSGPARQRDLITRQELTSPPQSDQDLFSAIRGLRPQFLAPPPGVSRTSSAPLAVYLNGLRQNGVSALGSIRASAVEEVRYLDPTASLNTYGPMASGGALVIKLYDPSKPKPPG